MANQKQQDAAAQDRIPTVTNAQPPGGGTLTNSGTQVARQGARDVNEIPNQQEQSTQD